MKPYEGIEVTITIFPINDRYEFMKGIHFFDMVKNIDTYLMEKTLEQLKEKYFDVYSKELQTFRGLPQEIQIRIYFEYWFLLKRLRNEQVKIKNVIKERDDIGLTINNFPISRIIKHISSNGCMNIHATFDKKGLFDTEETCDIDFNYFNKANLTYKAGKFTTDEIISTMSELGENQETMEKMFTLIIFLKEQIQVKESN